MYIVVVYIDELILVKRRKQRKLSKVRTSWFYILLKKQIHLMHNPFLKGLIKLILDQVF
jgi:hypothetical protein